MPFFWPKTVIFAEIRAELNFFFRRKMYLVRGKWSNLAKNWYTCTLGPLPQNLVPIFGYLVFLPFYGSRYVPKGVFLVNFGRFLPKITLSAYIGTRKMAKTPNIQKSILTIVEGS